MVQKALAETLKCHSSQRWSLGRSLRTATPSQEHPREFCASEIGVLCAVNVICVCHRVCTGVVWFPETWKPK
jgi:hypothetical protein